MLNTDRLCPGCMNDNGGEKICAVCGYDSSQKADPNYLPPRFWLSDRYMLGKVISENTQGVTYLGWDNAEDTAVRIVEYFPSQMAQRNPDKTVFIEEGFEFAFNEGLMDFLELNRKLMTLSSASVIPVLSVFEENGTAYAVTASFAGITLQSFLKRNGDCLKWEQARPLFLPLLDTLRDLHEIGVIHGGISPETVLVGRDGKLRIDEISIIRTRCAGGNFTATVYSGYAAPEQYGIDGMSIGSHTDVYALSATLFRVLIGTVPPVADERIHSDNLTIPAKFADELPRQVLVALANGLQINPKNRTQTIDSFKNELVYGETKENAQRAAANRRAQEERHAAKISGGESKKPSSAKYAVISAVCTAGFFIIIAGILCLTVFRDQVFGKNRGTQLDNSDIVSIPSIASIGDVDSDAAESKTLYAVPDVKGSFYSQVIDNEDYERFTFSIKGKEYSNKYPKGAICAQSLEPGKNVEKDTEIAVTISLGPQQIKVANVLGLSEADAKIELLKQGFLYDNIEVVDMYDSESKPGVVLEQNPQYGTSVNTEVTVRICVNSYTEDENSESDVQASNSSKKNKKDNF